MSVCLCFDSAPDWKRNWKVTWFCIGVKCFVIGEDGDLVWGDEFVSFKQQHAQALSELERQPNNLLDDS